MILNVKMNLSSAGACEVDSGERGGEANNQLNNSLPLPLPLPTYFFDAANTTFDTLFTHSTLKLTSIYHLNN